MHVRLVRHGQSAANTGEQLVQDVGDHNISLTALGEQQATEAGVRLGPSAVENALVYCSPYRRTRQTLAGLIRGAGLEAGDVRVFEDPRLREMEFGFEEPDLEAARQLRNRHGWFYYRFEGGESPADCYDRTSAFLESMMRQAERKQVENALIVAHGLTIRCFVMRFLHLTVEEFDLMRSPGNCDVVTIAPTTELVGPQFTSGSHGVVGLRLRDD